MTDLQVTILDSVIGLGMIVGCIWLYWRDKRTVARRKQRLLLQMAAKRAEARERMIRFNSDF